MTDPQTLSDRTKGKPSIDELSTVIWTPEMGQRLAIARMKLLCDQSEFAERLGLPKGSGQGVISRIELGRVRVTERVTLAVWKQVLGQSFMFVVFGTNPERFNRGVITDKYWDTRHRIRRKNATQCPYRRGRYNRGNRD